MAIAKRVFLFIIVNILVTMTIMLVLSLIGAMGFKMTPNAGSLVGLAVFSLIWGMAGALISLAMSRMMAKWMTGAKVIDPNTHDPRLRQLVTTVHGLARRAGLPAMPQVAIYESPEVNAFATGPTKSRSLVAVSTGLLQRLSDDQVEGVLGHEVAHIANGDMVTMTLIQGIVNAFVIFFAKIIAGLISQQVEERNRPMVRFAVDIAMQMVLSLLGAIVVCYFSRLREYRADRGGAQLAGREKMTSALRGLSRMHELIEPDQGSLQTLKISSRGGLVSLFSTHPPLQERIARLERGA